MLTIHYHALLWEQRKTGTLPIKTDSTLLQLFNQNVKNSQNIKLKTHLLQSFIITVIKMFPINQTSIVLSYDFRTTMITKHNLCINDITITFSYLVDVNGSVYNKTRKP